MTATTKALLDGLRYIRLALLKMKKKKHHCLFLDYADTPNFVFVMRFNIWPLQYIKCQLFSDIIK